MAAGLGTSIFTGYAHGPASAPNSTARAGGSLLLVTPIAIHTSVSFDGPVPGFAFLTLHFVPEPATAFLAGERRCAARRVRAESPARLNAAVSAVTRSVYPGRPRPPRRRACGIWFRVPTRGAGARHSPSSQSQSRSSPVAALAQSAAVRVASGLSSPVYVAAPVGDDRLFIVELRRHHQGAPERRGARHQLPRHHRSRDRARRCPRPAC